jgi:4-aminobutyrate aminotransferase
MAASSQGRGQDAPFREASSVSVHASARAFASLDAPRIVTELPGPRARALIARDAAVTSPSLTRSYPLVAARGSGYVIEDVDGNRFLDFAAGIAVASTGHAHPSVVEAIERQARELIHIAATDFYEPRYVELCERLAAIAPWREGARVFLTNSGTEAIEGAIKLARFHTRRSGIIAFEGAFHGRTMGALSVTTSKEKQRAGFGPFLPDVHVTRFPRVRGWDEGGDGRAEIADLRTRILGQEISPAKVAAIIIEPIQGEGGYYPAPTPFLKELRTLCDEHGILLIADEIQSGLGRTGRWFAIQHAGVEPDIVTVAKGIASGMPIGAFIGRTKLWSWKPGAHGSTFAGNPVCAAAALATLDLIEEGLMANAVEMGRRLRAGLERLGRRSPRIRDVRGIGLMIGVEFHSHEEANAVEQAAFQRGLLLLECGEASLRFCPPLVVDAPAVDRALELFAEALASAPPSSPGVHETGG